MAQHAYQKKGIVLPPIVALAWSAIPIRSVFCHQVSARLCCFLIHFCNNVIICAGYSYAAFACMMLHVYRDFE